MHSQVKRVRFMTWIGIFLFIILGSGFYFWSQEKYETNAGVVTSSPAIADNTLTTGLVGYWTFDRAHVTWADTTTEIKDTASTNHGNALGSLAAGSLVIGKQGQALNFNGTSDYISAPNTATFTDLSVSAWVYPTFSGSPDRYASVISNEATFDSIIYCGGTNCVYYVSLNAFSESTMARNIVTLNTWHHIVLTFNDAADRYDLYEDGILQPLDDNTWTGHLNTPSSTTEIGYTKNVGTRPYFPGKIDDVRIYNRTLSASEVYQLYTMGTNIVNAPVEDPLSQGLLGYWKMDEGTGTSTTADSSGNANTLTMTGPPAWTAGKIGPSSLDFSGTGQYLSVADPASGVLDFADGENFSITGWFNRDTFTTDDTIVAKKTDQVNNLGYIVWIDNNANTDYLNFVISDGSPSTASGFTNLSAVGWHHFAAISDDTNNMMYVYLDGRLDGSFVTISNSTLENTNAFCIGAESDAGNPFDGKLDDIRVYGYPLSAGDVLKLYQTTAPAQPVDTGLVGHWTFDGPDIQGTTVIDRSGKGNNGTATGTTKTIGKLGQGLNFSYNSTEAINVGSGTSLDDLIQKTLCAWIYPRSYGASASDAVLFNKDNAVGWSLLLADDNGPTNALYFFQTTWSGGLGKWRTGSSSVTLNTWQHICIAYDRSSASNDPVIYINATPVSVTEYSTPSGSHNSEASNILYLGNWDTSSTASFDGSLDDVRIYNRVLSSTEVADLYNIGR